MRPVRLSLAADPANVRVARLVAVSLARTAGFPEAVVDDVRLGVGEACGRAVLAHLDAGVDADVEVELSTGPGLVVRVTDVAGDGAPSWPQDDAGTAVAGDGAFVVDVVSLVRGVADHLDVQHGADGTTLVLTWESVPAA